MTCDDTNRDWRGITLSHIIALSQGGKTERGNCILECFPDHEKYEKKWWLRPLWQQVKLGLVEALTTKRDDIKIQEY